MIPQYCKEKDTKATMGLWCNLGIIGNFNYLLFRK